MLPRAPLLVDEHLEVLVAEGDGRVRPGAVKAGAVLVAPARAKQPPSCLSPQKYSTGIYDAQCTLLKCTTLCRQQTGGQHAGQMCTSR